MCNFRSSVRSRAKVYNFYAVKKELNITADKKIKKKHESSQQLEKEIIFWFPRGNNGQRRIYLCFPFSSGCQFLGNTPSD